MFLLTYDSMFFHLQYIHLFRPFLKYSPNSSPLPAHVSPRRICTANAGAISKLMRLYKKLYNLRQICNIAVYMLHSACTIHLLNLPERTAKRDIIHGVKHLEEIAEDWLCGRRTLSILSVLIAKWNVELPEEAAHVLKRTDEKWGRFSPSDVPSPKSHMTMSPSPPAYGVSSPHSKQDSYSPSSNQANAPASIQAISGASTPSDMMANMASSPTNFQPPVQGQTHMANNAAIMGNSVPMSVDGISSNTSWRQPPAMHAVTGFTPSYARMPNAMQSNRGVRNSPAQNPAPNSVYAVDGQDWYLKDSVNWQSSFDTWNMANSTSSATAAPNGGGMSDPSSVFVFTSNANDTGQSPQAATDTFNFDTMDDFAGNLGNWDLTGLD